MSKNIFIKCSSANDIDFIKNTYDYTIDNEQMIEEIINENTDNRIITISSTNICTLYTTKHDSAIIYLSNKDYLISKQVLKNMKLNTNEYLNKEIMCVGDDINITEKDFIFENIIGNEKLIIFIKNYTKDKKVQIILDYEYLQNQYIDNIFNALIVIKDQIIFLDIINITNNIYKDSVQVFISKLCDLKEKKINIFNEYSETLIYRPENKESEEDVGWYILRGMDMETKSKILEKLSESEKLIISMTICNEKYLIGKTTLAYQNENTYYDETTNVKDLILFPEEKKLLCFELIN